MKNQELEKIKELLKGVYRRFRSGAIGKDQAKCEADLLTSIIKAVELAEIKDQVKHLTSLLTSNKKN